MDPTQSLVSLAAQNGFDRAASLPLQKIWFHPEYYRYCEENLCGHFGTNWACPSAPGGAEYWNLHRRGYRHAVLVQSHGRFFKGAKAADAEALRVQHHWHFLAFVQAARAAGHTVQGFSADTCLVCETCTCPTAPCRHPDKCFPSVAGVGLDGAKVCALAGLPYGNFEEEITFLGLLLVQ